MQRGMDLKGVAAFNYVMRPMPTGALILEATATELIQFSPFNIMNGAAQMEAKYVVNYFSLLKSYNKSFMNTIHSRKCLTDLTNP